MLAASALEPAFIEMRCSHHWSRFADPLRHHQPALTHSEARNLSFVTYTKNLSRVIESYFQGKSLALTERAVPLEMCFQEILHTQLKLPMCAKHILSLLQMSQG